jgi:hypothetical protein
MLRHDNISQNPNVMIRAQSGKFVKYGLARDAVTQQAEPLKTTESDEAGGSQMIIVAQLGHG